MSSISENPDLTAEEVAARLLITASAMDDLSLADGFKIVSYMRPKRLEMGALLFKEGDSRKTDFMVLVLEGDVSVENSMAGHKENLVVSVMGPGSIIGEMGVLDGQPRSATCTAATDVVVAILTRTSLMRLMKEHPPVGARFLLALSKRMADHLRETTRKLKSFAQMNATLREELDLVLNNRTVLKADQPELTGSGSGSMAAAAKTKAKDSLVKLGLRRR